MMNDQQGMPDSRESDKLHGGTSELPVDVDALSVAQAEKLLEELQRRRRSRSIPAEPVSGPQRGDSAPAGSAHEQDFPPPASAGSSSASAGSEMPHRGGEALSAGSGVESGGWDRPMMEALPDMVFRMNRQGQVVNFVSTRALERSCPRERFIDRMPEEFLSSRSAQRVRSAVARTLESGAGQTVKLELAFDGFHRQCEGRLVLAGPEEVVLIVQDTEVPPSQASPPRMQQVLQENVCEGCMVVDDRHRVVGYNRRLVSLLELSEEILSDRPDVRVVLRLWAERSGLGERRTERLLSDIDRRQPFTMDLDDLAGGRVLEMRHSPLPGGGFARTVTDVTERRRQEKLLEETRTRIDQMLEACSNILYRYNVRRQQYDYISSSVEEIVGTPLDDVRRMPWNELSQAIHPEDRPELEAILDRARRGPVDDPQPITLEYRRKVADGSWRWFRDRFCLDYGDQGELLHITGEACDITDRKQTRDELGRHKQFVQALFDASPQPMFSKDASGRYRGCNRALEEFLGLEAEQILGKTSFDLFPDRQAEVLFHYDQVLMTKPGLQQFETQLVTAGGMKRDVLISRATYADAGGRVAGMVGVISDITQQEDGEHALLMREDQYRQMFELNRAVKLLVDSETGVIVDANPAAADFYGYKVRELKQMSISDINILPREQVVEEMIRAQSEQRPYFEFRHRLATGEIRDVEVFSGPVQVGDQTLLYSIITDVTERNGAEEELRQSQEMYQTLFETMPVGISILDERGMIVEANQESERILGLSAAQQKGRRHESEDWKYIRPDGTRMAPEEYPSVRALREDRRVEHCQMGFVRTDGRVSWLEMTAAPIPLPGYGVAVAYRDITGRRIAERALSEREEQYRQIFESVNDCLLVYDQDHCIVEANPAACETYGYSRDELLQCRAGDLIQPEYLQDFENFGRQLQTQGYFYSESVNVRKDGSPFDVDIRGTYFNYLGKPHLLAIVRDITKRKQAERALRESEERFRRAFEDAAIGMALVGTDGVFIDANAALCEMLGYGKDDLRAVSFQDITHPEDRRIGRETLPKMLSGQQQRVSHEKRYLHKNGQVVWTQETSSVIWDVYNRPLYLVSQIQNITDRKQAEAALRKSEERYRIVSELASDYAYAMVVGPGETLRTEWMTDAFKRITGYDPRELDELGWEHHVHPDDLADFQRHVSAVLNNRHDAAEYRIFTKDGRVIWLADSAQPVWDDAHQRVVRLFGAAKDVTEQRLAEKALRQARDELEVRVQERTRDLTAANSNLQAEIAERKRAEDALRDSERKFRTLAETVTTGVLILDGSSVSYANRAAERIIGHDRDELYAMDLFQVVHEPMRDALRRRCDQALQEEPQPWRGEVRLVTRDGQNRWIDWSLASIHYEGKRGSLVSLHDITERKQAENELREAHLQLLNAREQERRSLASELHDSFAQDLVVLQLMLQRGMTSPLGAGGNRGEWLGQAGKMCSRLIRDIRHICHGLYPPQLETLGLRQALVSLGEYYEAGDLHVDIRWNCGPDDLRFTPEVEIVLFRIAQEAVSNAMRHGEARNCSVDVGREGAMVLMTIEDDGIGFDTGSNKKSGLGLQTMNDRAGAIGGYCEVQSSPGHTVIRAFLPWRESQAPVVPADAEPASPSGSPEEQTEEATDSSAAPEPDAPDDNLYPPQF